MSSRAGRGPGRAWLGPIRWRFGPTREEAVAAQAQTGGGGTAGNERLTGSTSLLLLLLLAAEGVTILFLGPLLPEHIFIGMVLIPPVALKLGSTGYRMVRYYGGSPTYRAEGPPRIALRAMAPVLVLSTLALLGTGVGLIVVGPGHETLLTLHKASFVVWVAFIAVHALAYVLRIPWLASADWRRTPGRARLRGGGARRALVIGSLLAGVVLGAIVLGYSGAWTHRDRDERAERAESVPAPLRTAGLTYMPRMSQRS
jgi:hypothetical protein